MRLSVEADLDYWFDEGADVLLTIEVAQLEDQQVHWGELKVTSPRPLVNIPGEESFGRRTWTFGEGSFRANYRAEVTVEHTSQGIEGLGIVPRVAVPGLVVPYLWPSRYCESDRFEAFVTREFEGVEGGTKILLMADWIFQHIEYRSGSSNGLTTAVDTFIQRQGVCRDFAHLLASFARAAGIPARLVSAYALGLEPQDFHAVVEVWLDDGWHIVDATRLASTDSLARIAVGRDATDIAFMTIFGRAMMNAQRVSVTRLDDVPLR